jgi:hypothetical protein
MSLQLKASKSYWIAKRDEQFSLLDILLNKSVVSDSAGDIQSKINEVIKEIAISIKAIEVIENLMDSTSVEETNTGEKN